MTILTQLKDRVTNAARAESARYAEGADRPLGGYAVTMSVYASTIAALAGAVRLAGRGVPDRLTAGDVALCAASTHKLSRLIAKDPVTSPLRAPFTSYRGTQAPAELAEDVRGEGGRKTVGELVTCPFCTGTWVATGLMGGLLLLPRTTRIVMAGVTALAGADMLHFAHSWLDKISS